MDIKRTDIVNIIVNFLPKKPISIIIEVMQIPTDVKENAIALPMVINWLWINGFKKIISEPLQKYIGIPIIDKITNCIVWLLNIVLNKYCFKLNNSNRIPKIPANKIYISVFLNNE